MTQILDVQTSTEPAPASPATTKQARHPMVFPVPVGTPLPPVRLTHLPANTRVTSTLTYTRLSAEIFAEAHKQASSLIDSVVIQGAADLPEVVSYLALRDKGAGLGDAIVRLEADLAKFDADRQSTLANKDVEAKKLAEELSKIDAERKTVSARIEGFKSVQASALKGEKDLDAPEKIADLEEELSKLDGQWSKALEGSATGEKLGAALAKIEARQKALKDRIADCRRGQVLLAEEVAKARGLALKALEAHGKSRMSTLYGEADKLLNTVAAAIEAEKHFFALLEQAALADRVAELVRTQIRTAETGGISMRLKAILDPAKPATQAKEEEPASSPDTDA